MSETEQRQRVTPGDTVRLKSFPNVDMRVFAVTEEGIIGYWADESAPELRRRRWADIIEPEQPKAKPGVRYKVAPGWYVAPAYEFAIGTADGFLTFDCGLTSFKLDDSWIEA